MPGRLISRQAILIGCGLLFLSALSLFASSGDWFTRVWQTDDGLPDNVISGLVQTSDGFLWVGTQGGLMRFDGTEFQEFSPVNIADAPNRVVRALVRDRKDSLWIGMDRGFVVSVEGDRARIFTEKDGLPPALVREMVEDGEGAIWISYLGFNGLCRIKDGQVRRFGDADGLSGPSFCWLACDNLGQLWFTKGNAVGVFRDGRFKILQKLNVFSARLTGSRSGGVWITTATQLFKYREGGTLEEKGNLPVPDPEPGVVFEDRAGAVWIGTAAAYGLFKYDGVGFETVHMSHPSINCITEDREGNLWVGTGGGGLIRLRPRILELLNVQPDRPIDSVRSVCADTGGAVWAVTREGLLMRQSKAGWENILLATNWPGGHASCVAAGPNGAVWIGMHNAGLYRFQNNEFTIWRKESGRLADDSVRSLLVSSNGDVWVGIDTPRQLQRLHNGKFSSFDMPPGGRTIRAMAEDTKGNFWLATAEGQLLRVTGDELIRETTNGPSQVFSIRCLHATADGSIWIGYADGGGLGRLKNGKYSRFTTAQGLNDNYISQIISDQEGWLWLAGAHGFYRVQIQQLTDVAEGRERQVRSVKFGRGEGLPSLQANYDNYPSALLGRDDRPRIATRTGLAVIHTENIRDNPEPPPVLVDRAMVDGAIVGLYNSRSPLRERGVNEAADLKLPGTLRLPPSHHRIEFDFVAPSLTAPENVQFRYRMEGFDEDWIDGDVTRHASYSRLPAGSYHFRVIACNQSGVWNEAGATVNLMVSPFFWQTWWFQIAVLAGFTLSVIAVVRYVSFRRLRGQLRAIEQQAALDEERARIARDLHDDLGGSLTQVALMLDMPQEKSAVLEEHVRQCSSMVRQVVKAVDGIIWAINPRNDTLPYLIDYISEFAVEFLQAAEIRCRVELPDDLPERLVSPEARHNLFLVVKQALNNIACHAHATEVWLRVGASEGRIEIEIKDNGRGFIPAPNPRANGLRNMRQRMEEIGGKFILESKPGEGTKILAVYPLPGA